MGSLFSGIGGIELGLERTGAFTTTWFVEQHPYCQAVLRQHWPSAPIYDDVTTINWHTLPRIDVLTGGFPCQDLSTAGKRRGISPSTRSGLWQHYATAINVLKPRYVLIENVAGLLTLGLDTVIRDLQRAGYQVLARLITAQEVGAPHRRERLYLVAHAAPQRCTLRLRTHLQDALCVHDPWNPTTHWEKWRDLAARINQNIRTRNWQQASPGIRRVDDGISHGMDRTACLGNSVIPQISTAIGNAISRLERNAPTASLPSQ